jgi:outer membrane receptor protein involved in Fe transport
VVFTPQENHSFRFSVNRAFQTPNYSEFFLRAPAGTPTTGPATVEAGIENHYTQVQASLPPSALAGLTLHSSLPWNFPAQTQVLALGNPALDVETVLGWELGYKGSLSNTLYFTADFYINELENFVTDLLPGVNPLYPTFQLTDNGINLPADLTALSQRIDQLESGGQISPAQAAALRAPIPVLQGGFRINNNLRIHATATNVLDQERFQLYGGSVIRRRVLGGLTANF